MLINNDKFKEVFTIEWSDFQEKLGNYFLTLLGSTNKELLEAITTKIDTSLTGNLMYQVYVNDTLEVSSELYFSLVNTYNYLRYGQIKTYVASVLDG